MGTEGSTTVGSFPNSDDVVKRKEKSPIGLIVGGVIGLSALAIMAVATPFVLPALRKHCLPYVPATDAQLSNLAKAIKKYSKEGDKFLDVGSGDGRICRLSADLGLFSQVHGVELNLMLVLYSRMMAMKSRQYLDIKYFHRDLWNFSTESYGTICIFGVESMMDSFTKYLKDSNKRPQTIIACRFPLKKLPQLDKFGTGIDTVWVYNLP